jgi:hypothetical protein
LFLVNSLAKVECHLLTMLSENLPKAYSNLEIKMGVLGLPFL